MTTRGFLMGYQLFFFESALIVCNSCVVKRRDRWGISDTTSLMDGPTTSDVSGRPLALAVEALHPHGRDGLSAVKLEAWRWREDKSWTLDRPELRAQALCGDI